MLKTKTRIWSRVLGSVYMWLHLKGVYVFALAIYRHILYLLNITKVSINRSLKIENVYLEKLTFRTTHFPSRIGSVYYETHPSFCQEE